MRKGLETVGASLRPVEMNDASVLSRKYVAEKVGLSQPTIWREQAAGRFPPYQQLSARRVGLRASDLYQWLAGRRDWSECAK
jgi:predicted DNA-binding transcriptional regulator AlpA